MNSAISWIRSSPAQIVFLVAPAGYGKTTLAERLRGDYERSAVCDCAQASLPRSFAQNLLGALSAENPEDADYYSELGMRLRALSDDADLRNIIEPAWRRNTARCLFVFENAEALANNGVVAPLLTRLLQSAPETRRVVICSRVPLPTRAGRYLAPHRMLTITTEHLALSDEESRTILRENGVPEAEYSQILQVSQGWPILLLLLGRLSLEGRLQTILQRSDLALEVFFSYLVNEVIEPLQPQTLLALTLCATVPRITSKEIADALALPVSAVNTLLRGAPLLHRDGETLAVHQVLKDALIERTPEWNRYALGIAQAAEARGDAIRAAQLYRLFGDEDASARVLEGLSVDRLMSPAYAEVLTNIPPSAMRKHPKLTLAIFNHVGFTPELRGQLLQIYEALDDDEDPALIANLARAIVSANWWFGDVEGNDSLLSGARLQRALASGSVLAREAFLGVRECFYAGLGVVESNFEAMKAAYHQALRATLPHPRTLLARKIASSERWRGNAESSAYWVEAALAHAQESGSALLYSSLIVDAMLNAWFWGDDERFAQYETRLESWSADNGFGSDFSSLHAALRGEADTAAVPLPKPNAVMCELIAASYTADPDARAKRIAHARSLAQTTGEVPLAVLCDVAAAATFPARRDDILTLTALSVDAAELPNLRAAVFAYKNGAPSFLDAFIRRFSGAQAQTTGKPDVEIQILQQRIRIGENYLKLSARESALVAYICRQRSAISREEIQDALWPELDETSARDSLYSLLYRIRKRTGKLAIIENCGNAYRIVGDASVDLWSLQNLVRELQRGKDVPLDVVERWYHTVRQRSYSDLLLLEWFGSVDYQVREASRTLARRLIDDAFASGHLERALVFGNMLIEQDEVDDWGHEAIIRVHLERGNFAEAQRSYRLYCLILKKSIEAGPAPEIEALMQRHRLQSAAS